MDIKKFLSEWKENRTKVYKKRTWFSKLTDYVALILIIFAVGLYLYHNIPVSKNQQYSASKIDSNSNKNKTQSSDKGSLLQPKNKKPNIFQFFQINVIDIIIVIITVGVYLYLKYYHKKKKKK